MKRESITAERIDALLRFLPLFEAPGTQFVHHWAGGELTEEGTLTVPFPVYTDEVLLFFRLAGQTWWSDFGYNPREAREMLKDDAFIARATLDEVRTMLTYCVRAERFGDGMWAYLIESGQIVALLRRLAVLRDALHHGAEQ